MRPSRAVQRPAGAVPSQGQPCPTAPRPRHPLPSRRSLPELRSQRRRSCSSSARTFGRRRWIAPAAEVSPPSPRGDRWRRTKARGAPGSGGRQPQRGESRARGVAWAPARAREGAGGAASGSAGRAGRAAWTAHEPRLPAPGRCRRSLCAQPPGPLGGWVGLSRASVSGAGDSSVRPRVGASCSPRGLSAIPARRPGLRFQAVGAGVGGLGLAALDGWRTCWGYGKRRHRCSFGYFAEEGSRAGRDGYLVWEQRRIDGGWGDG